MNRSGSGSSQHPSSRQPILFPADSGRSPDAAPEKAEHNWLPWIIATAVICVGLAALFWLGRPPASSVGAGVDPYAKNVALTNVEISQASNFAGDQLTYVDGTIENRGNRTITSVTLQALFANDSGEAPQTLLAPVSLIRSRDPYVDTELLSAAPLPAGKSQDFRLVFDSVSPMWNQQIPKLTVLHVTTRP